MDQHLQQSWDELRRSVSIEQNVSAMTMALYLLLGAAMSLYIRFLYRQCSASANDADGITRIFPLLTMVTIGVISVVKSSMALSLGLVGALSIVRFRSAIKEPEELVYLFLCIGVGLALGAGQPLLAVVLVVVVSLVVLTMHFTSGGRREQNLLLTITGDSERYFRENESSALVAVEENVVRYALQRYDVENNRGQLRVVIKESHPRETINLIARLRERLPECEISYVNLNTSW